jgi:hypothetical protein
MIRPSIDVCANRWPFTSVSPTMMPNEVPSGKPTTLPTSNDRSNSDSSSTSGLSSGGAVAVGVIVSLVAVGMIILGYVKWYAPKHKDKTQLFFATSDVFNVLAPKSTDSKLGADVKRDVSLV